MKQRLASQADVEKGGGFSVPVEGEGSLMSTANPLEGSGPGAHDDRGSSGGFTFGVESSLAKTLSSSHTEQEQRNLGEQVSKIILITPTILNWLSIMVARFISTAEIVDSENITHDVPRSRNFNFNFVFYSCTASNITTVSTHVWLTLGAIARKHKLDQRGAADGVGYSARLTAADTEARRLSVAELRHIGLIGFDVSARLAFSD